MVNKRVRQYVFCTTGTSENLCFGGTIHRAVNFLDGKQNYFCCIQVRSEITLLINTLGQHQHTSIILTAKANK